MAKAFQVLRDRFTSAPVLVLMYPRRWFVAEVYASDIGIGVVLSQRDPIDGRLYPCAYLSHYLSSAECNYNIGNRELLAVKVALEEWRHWLEGADLPFLVWTNHKNLEYLQSAKILNSRQALFCNQFNFHLSYRPGSKNAKPDALSRFHSPDLDTKGPAFILP